MINTFIGMLQAQSLTSAKKFQLMNEIPMLIAEDIHLINGTPNRIHLSNEKA